MKNTISSLALAASLFAGVALATTPEETTTPAAPTAPAAEETALPVLPAYFKNIQFLTGAPSMEADYYIYLFSASWCGPCRAIMPSFVEQYPEMKANKVEIIFISVDDSAEEAKAYIEHYNAGFPGLYVRTKEVKELPSLIIPRGIPTATILDANGKVLFNGHAAKALNWKELCKPAAK